MKKSTKKSILIGAAAALAASLVPYECKVEENGDFSFTSLFIAPHPYSQKNKVNEKAITIRNI